MRTAINPIIARLEVMTFSTTNFSKESPLSATSMIDFSLPKRTIANIRTIQHVQTVVNVISTYCVLAIFTMSLLIL